jgi:predicted nucleic acid-binding protein
LTDKAEQLIAFTTTCVVADLTTEIAIFAAEICARHKADLLTCDRHFENLPGVCYFPKSVP